MPEFNVEVVFDVYCACGAPLCNQCDTNDYARGPSSSGRSLTVEPCTVCLDRAHREGYDERDADYDERDAETGHA